MKKYKDKTKCKMCKAWNYPMEKPTPEEIEGNPAWLPGKCKECGGELEKIKVKTYTIWRVRK